MPEKIYCLLCKEILVTKEEKIYGTHFHCSADFAKSNIFNLASPDDSLVNSESPYQILANNPIKSSLKSFSAVVLFNSFIIGLFLILIAIQL